MARCSVALVLASLLLGASCSSLDLDPQAHDPRETDITTGGDSPQQGGTRRLSGSGSSFFSDENIPGVWINEIFRDHDHFEFMEVIVSGEALLEDFDDDKLHLGVSTRSPYSHRTIELSDGIVTNLTDGARAIRFKPEDLGFEVFPATAAWYTRHDKSYKVYDCLHYGTNYGSYGMSPLCPLIHDPESDILAPDNTDWLSAQRADFGGNQLSTDYPGLWKAALSPTTKDVWNKPQHHAFKSKEYEVLFVDRVYDGTFTKYRYRFSCNGPQDALFFNLVIPTWDELLQLKYKFIPSRSTDVEWLFGKEYNHKTVELFGSNVYRIKVEDVDKLECSSGGSAEYEVSFWGERHLCPGEYIVTTQRYAYKYSGLVPCFDPTLAFGGFRRLETEEAAADSAAAVSASDRRGSLRGFVV